VNAVMNLRVPYYMGNFLNSWGHVSWSGRTTFYGAILFLKYSWIFLRKHPWTTIDEPARISEVISLGTIIKPVSSMAEDTGFLWTSSEPISTLR
jgi:hypothetical protein